MAKETEKEPLERGRNPEGFKDEYSKHERSTVPKCSVSSFFFFDTKILFINFDDDCRRSKGGPLLYLGNA